MNWIWTLVIFFVALVSGITWFCRSCRREFEPYDDDYAQTDGQRWNKMIGGGTTLLLVLACSLPGWTQDTTRISRDASIVNRGVNKALVIQPGQNYQDTDGMFKRWTATIDSAATFENAQVKYNLKHQRGKNLFRAGLDSSIWKFEHDGAYVIQRLLNPRKKSATWKRNQVVWKNALKATDILLTPTPDGVKEDIILRAPAAPDTIVFELETSDKPVIGNAGVTVGPLTLPNPTATDGTGAAVDADWAWGNPVNGKYSVKVWADVSGGEYPYTIDPSISRNIAGADSVKDNLLRLGPTLWGRNTGGEDAVFGGAVRMGVNSGEKAAMVIRWNLQSILPVNVTIDSGWAELTEESDWGSDPDSIMWGYLDGNDYDWIEGTGDFNTYDISNGRAAREGTTDDTLWNFYRYYGRTPWQMHIPADTVIDASLSAGDLLPRLTLDPDTMAVWHGDSTKNAGIYVSVVDTSSGDLYLVIGTRENSTVAYRPKLTVYYTEIPDPTPVTDLVFGSIDTTGQFGTPPIVRVDSVGNADQTYYAAIYNATIGAWLDTNASVSTSAVWRQMSDWKNGGLGGRLAVAPYEDNYLYVKASSVANGSVTNDTLYAEVKDIHTPAAGLTISDDRFVPVADTNSAGEPVLIYKQLSDVLN